MPQISIGPSRDQWSPETNQSLRPGMSWGSDHKIASMKCWGVQSHDAKLSQNRISKSNRSVGGATRKECVKKHAKWKNKAWVQRFYVGLCIWYLHKSTYPNDELSKLPRGGQDIGQACHSTLIDLIPESEMSKREQKCSTLRRQWQDMIPHLRIDVMLRKVHHRPLNGPFLRGCFLPWRGLPVNSPVSRRLKCQTAPWP